MTARRPCVAGNWKMHMLRAEAVELARGVASAATGHPNVEVAVFPPFTSLDAVRGALAGSPVKLGAQACHDQTTGAHTGEVSAAMLADAGCQIVLCGHSERRAAGESDAAVGSRARAVLAAGLRAIICIGETLEERESDSTAAVLVRQLDAALDGIDAAALERVDLAYEPVWAIGTGRTATPEIAVAAHAVIRTRMRALYADAGNGPRILYGGSVKPGNARELLSSDDIGGVLVGGASLDAASFRGIIEGA